MTELAGWNGENLKLTVPFKISEDLYASIQSQGPDPFVKLSGASGYLYGNPQDNNTWAAADAKAWWGLLVEIVILLLEAAMARADLDYIVQLSVTAHRILRATPASLWNCVSLEAHIKSTMTKTVESEKDANAGSSNNNEIPVTTTTTDDNDEDEDDDDDDDDDEEASTSEIVSPGLPYSLLFARKVEAACAWTTAARQLYRSKIAASGMGFAYRILQLPRTSVAEYSATEIISRWHTRGNWPAASTRALEKKWMQKAKMQTLKGVVHCEAGILAALCATEAEADCTPKIVEEAFNSLQLASASTPIPIGIAKKCCPACAILAKLVGKTQQIDVGKHSRWHAWVPPEWLPATVMVELEMKFLEALQSMVADPWATSAASSPTSTPGGSPPDQFRINKNVSDIKAKSSK